MACFITFYIRYNLVSYIHQDDVSLNEFDLPIEIRW